MTGRTAIGTLCPERGPAGPRSDVLAGADTPLIPSDSLWLSKRSIGALGTSGLSEGPREVNRPTDHPQPTLTPTTVATAVLCEGGEPPLRQVSGRAMFKRTPRRGLVLPAAAAEAVVAITRVGRAI